MRGALSRASPLINVSVIVTQYYHRGASSHQKQRLLATLLHQTAESVINQRRHFYRTVCMQRRVRQRAARAGAYQSNKSGSHLSSKYIKRWQPAVNAVET